MENNKNELNAVNSLCARMEENQRQFDRGEIPYDLYNERQAGYVMALSRLQYGNAKPMKKTYEKRCTSRG
jgi:hypothetical protein